MPRHFPFTVHEPRFHSVQHMSYCNCPSLAGFFDAPHLFAPFQCTIYEGFGEDVEKFGRQTVLKVGCVFHARLVNFLVQRFQVVQTFYHFVDEKPDTGGVIFVGGINAFFENRLWSVYFEMADAEKTKKSAQIGMIKNWQMQSRLQKPLRLAKSSFDVLLFSVL
uniref:Uncharacterized protein n=1 Tax=Romanomermis culicivorax TaxID=13658 RepID=A0A915J8N3_ROMCU